ncbi:CGNR zinc finger domain-containing protein [Luteimonas viscosa]|uniref:CGNR zinc finger domain-containing protein n=1 Tax=Luteimonas viscosa TaxID=1132694 RepID=A0A5D4XTV0_9GAMM|nr:CGNR zinc finger domain-containing protein [Luteimonas viscosa]
MRAGAVADLRGPSETLPRLSRCGWLFLDTSRNDRRQWCAMDTCGAASKMARYRARKA